MKYRYDPEKIHKRQMAFELAERGFSIREVCLRAGISRAQYYRFRERRDAGECIWDRSRAPVRIPHKLPSEQESIIIQLSQARILGVSVVGRVRSYAEISRLALTHGIKVSPSTVRRVIASWLSSSVT